MEDTLYKCVHCNNVVAVEKSVDLEQCRQCGEGSEKLNLYHWKEIGDVY